MYIDNSLYLEFKINHVRGRYRYFKSAVLQAFFRFFPHLLKFHILCKGCHFSEVTKIFLLSQTHQNRHPLFETHWRPIGDPSETDMPDQSHIED